MGNHIVGRGVHLYRAACAEDLEGIVAKWRHGVYQSGGGTTSWLKIKNPNYTQAEGRHELFAARAEGHGSRGRYVAPLLVLA